MKGQVFGLRHHRSGQTRLGGAVGGGLGVTIAGRITTYTLLA